MKTLYLKNLHLKFIHEFKDDFEITAILGITAVIIVALQFKILIFFAERKDEWRGNWLLSLDTLRHWGNEEEREGAVARLIAMIY